jgi:hypothetical protein
LIVYLSIPFYFSFSENATIEPSLPSTMMPIVNQLIEEHNNSIESSSIKPEKPHVETAQQPTIDLNIDNETETELNHQHITPVDTIDLPRQVHVHDPAAILSELKDELNKNENLILDEEIENNTTVASFLVNDHSPHLPRILENDEQPSNIDSVITSTVQTIENHNETKQNLSQIESKVNDIISMIF